MFDLRISQLANIVILDLGNDWEHKRIMKSSIYLAFFKCIMCTRLDIPFEPDTSGHESVEVMYKCKDTAQEKYVYKES